MLGILEALTELGLSRQDIALMTLCPLAATLGSFVHMFMIENDFSRMPRLVERGQTSLPRSIFSPLSWLVMFESKRWYWVWGRLTIGLATGLLVALYFTGSIATGATSSAKVIALALVAGYLAPKLFAAQERAVERAIEKHLPEAVEAVARKQLPRHDA